MSFKIALVVRWDKEEFNKVGYIRHWMGVTHEDRGGWIDVLKISSK